MSILLELDTMNIYKKNPTKCLKIILDKTPYTGSTICLETLYFVDCESAD